MLRSCLFATQTALHNMSAAVRGEEIEAVRCEILRIIPKLHNESSDSSKARSEAAFIGMETRQSTIRLYIVSVVEIHENDAMMDNASLPINSGLA